MRTNDFSCDGLTIKLRGRFPSLVRTASFAIAGRPAVMTKRTVLPRLRLRYKRAFGSSWRQLPSTILAYALGGAGIGGGVAAANATPQTVAWVVHELVVDGKPRGAWVATTREGSIPTWSFVPPGHELPDGRDDTWGLQTPLSSRHLHR